MFSPKFCGKPFSSFSDNGNAPKNSVLFFYIFFELFLVNALYVLIY